jgi:hypothetical protein
MGVLAVDYRTTDSNNPHRFPEALNDVIDGFEWLQSMGAEELYFYGTLLLYQAAHLTSSIVLVDLVDLIDLIDLICLAGLCWVLYSPLLFFCTVRVRVQGTALAGRRQSRPCCGWSTTGCKGGSLASISQLLCSSAPGLT